jgi:ankyrin repeat protein
MKLVETKSEPPTPFFLACGFGLPWVVELLIRSKDTDLELENERRNKALHLGARWGHCQVVKQILTDGCDPNFRSQNGLTALHEPAIHGHASVVKIPLEYADPSLENIAATSAHQQTVEDTGEDLLERLMQQTSDQDDDDDLL